MMHRTTEVHLEFRRHNTILSAYIYWVAFYRLLLDINALHDPSSILLSLFYFLFRFTIFILLQAPELHLEIQRQMAGQPAAPLGGPSVSNTKVTFLCR